MPLVSQATLTLSQYNSHEGRRLHFYSKGEEIPLLPQGIWQIHQGLVQLSTLCPNGEEISLGWAVSENFFGTWLSSLPAYKAIALSDIYLRWFSVVEVESSLALSQLVLPQIVRRLRQAELLLTIAGYRRVEDRLLRLLWLLKQETGQSVPSGTRLRIRLTHQQIANAIATTRVTVTRLLSKFQAQGLISLDRDRHIILKDEQFLSIPDF